jgi:hypothetical protein
MNNTDHISESSETNFWVKILKFFDADRGWKKFGSGIRVLAELVQSCLGMELEK